MSYKDNKQHDDEHDHDTHDLPSHRGSKYYETYVRLTDARCIFIAEDFTKQLASEVVALLLHFDSLNDDEITIYIHSSGGDSTALSAIESVIQGISSSVSTICLGKAYSAGAFLLCAGKKGRRYATKNSEIMIHGISCLYPNINESSVSQSKSYLDFISSVDNEVMKMLAKNTGQPLEKVKEDCSRDFFLTAKEAKAYGIIDSIL